MTDRTSRKSPDFSTSEAQELMESIRKSWMEKLALWEKKSAAQESQEFDAQASGKLELIGKALAVVGSTPYSLRMNVVERDTLEVVATGLLEPITEPANIGWDVIDRKNWDRLARLLNLPEEARIDLVRIVRAWRWELSWQRNSGDGELPSKVTKELARLRKLADQLSDGLRNCSSGARYALNIALSKEENKATVTSSDRSVESFGHVEGKGKSLDERLDEAFSRFEWPGDSSETINFWCLEDRQFRLHLDALEGWRERLLKADENVKTWRKRSGPNRSLRDVVERLDRFLLCHTGKGLVRSSMKTKTRRGRAKACADFVLATTRMIFGNVREETIDDAIKDVIARKRFVGKS